VPLANRTGYFIQPVVKRVPGAIEGEKMKILAKTTGPAREQDMFDSGDKWSGGAHLRWMEAQPGDKLDLALPVDKAGQFKLLAQLTKAPRYGIFQLSLDGRKLGGPIDLHNSDVIPTGELDLGTHELTAGEHKLSVEIIGANPKAGKKFMFGLDYVKLEPVP